MREQTSAIQILFATIVTIAIILAIAGWSNDRDLTSVINTTLALWRNWYVLSEFQEKPRRRAAKHSTTITTVVTTITTFVLPAAAGRN
jgi:hypothetical protein